MEPVHAASQTAQGVRSDPAAVRQAPARSAASRLLALQRVIGNVAVQRLLQQAPSRPTLVQRRPGDSLVINENDVAVRKTRSRTSASFPERLKRRTVGVEMEGRSERWLKLRVVGLPATDERDLLGIKGWIVPSQADVEPGTIRPNESVGKAPDQFAGVPDPLFGVNGPAPSDIQQGGLGDCWLLSPLGSIAATPDGKKLIRDMITVEPGETPPETKYHVRLFWHAKGGEFVPREVEVTNVFPLDSKGRPIYARSKGALWPMVIEKAVADSHGGYFNLVGGTERNAYAVIAGRFPKEYTLATGDEEPGLTRLGKQIDLYHVLAKAREAGKPVSAGIPKSDFTEELNFTPVNGEPGMYFAFVNAVPTSGRIGLKLTYKADGKEVRKTSIESTERDLNLKSEDLFGDEPTWIAEFRAQPGEKRATIPASVTYRTADLGEDIIRGNHAYMVPDLNRKKHTVTLLDPHASNKPVEITFDQIQKYDIQFQVGELPEK